MEYGCFTTLYYFLVAAKQISCIFAHIPSFFGFPPRLGPHRAPRRVPCAVAQVLVSYLFYTRYCAPFLCQILGGSGYLREACCPGGFRREGPLRFFFFKLKCNIHQGKCVSAKDTTQSVFAQLHTQVTISQMKIRIISKPLKVPPELSQITPPPTGAVLILSPCMALPGLNFIKMIIMLIYSSCSSFFLKICFFSPRSSLHVIHMDVFGPSLISSLPRRIPPEGCTLSLMGLWVVGSSGYCDKDGTYKSFGACYSCPTWGAESERIFSILKMFLDKTRWF